MSQSMQAIVNSNPSDKPLSVDEARARIVELCRPVAGIERLGVREALGRVSAEAVASAVDVPAHDNSAMDGYAVRFQDLESCDYRLSLIGESFAGRPFDGTVDAGQAVRIMTGAVMPAGADTVVMQEQVEADGERIHITSTKIKKADNVRYAGEDIKTGATALGAGALIGPTELGLLASVGAAEVAVRRRVRVAFFSTGDELRSIGQELGEGDIHDSNRYTLLGMLRRLGVELIDLGVVPDVPEALERTLTDAAACADAIITSGGVSVGEADFVKQMLEKLGTVDFWKINMKPGRPLAYGEINGARFFGLPGNPVSVMVSFYQFVQPAIWRMMGREDLRVPEFTAISQEAFRKRRGRTEFQRGVVAVGPDGEMQVRATGAQGSGILRSMHEANCFVILPAEAEEVPVGERLRVQPFWGLM